MFVTFSMTIQYWNSGVLAFRKIVYFNILLNLSGFTLKPMGYNQNFKELNCDILWCCLFKFSMKIQECLRLPVLEPSSISVQLHFLLMLQVRLPVSSISDNLMDISTWLFIYRDTSSSHYKRIQIYETWPPFTRTSTLVPKSITATIWPAFA
jgi:hypothetical protein